MEDIHKHCLTCYSFIFCTSAEDSCEFVQCPEQCGAVFHGCKEAEHYLLCSQVKVPCINKPFGCSTVMRRKDINAHLALCPASVVVCMAEWNRWPIYSSDRQKMVRFRQKNPYAEDGQLDYDLAMRDERMLNNLGKISRKTRLSLRNNLTRRYPVVPLPNVVLERNLNSDELLTSEDSLLDLGKFNEFSGIQVDSKLSKQMKEWEEDLNNRLKEKNLERPSHYWEFPEMEKGNIHKHCAYCFRKDCPKSFDFDEPHDTRACQLIECRWKCGAVFHSCKQFEHIMICPTYEEQDDYAWMFKGVTERGMKLSRKSLKKPKPLKEQPSLYSGPSEPAIRKFKRGIPVPPVMPKSVQKSCRLDIRLDTVTRLQTKPKSMYTFACAQEFRRDEFPHHSKNVHNDIHGGLNNWIEHRCPMSTYGCHFSWKRMHPHDKKYTVIFNQELESFGVTMKRTDEKKKEKTNVKKARSPKSLLDLPMEILFKIFYHLDSFTLGNLAVTNVGLRNICCSLLDTKGCVSLQWERIKVGKKYHWDVAYKRWFFSTAISPIEKWSFTDEEGVSKHLQTCPFNVRSKPNDMRKSKEFKEVLRSLKEKYKAKKLYV